MDHPECFSYPDLKKKYCLRLNPEEMLELTMYCKSTVLFWIPFFIFLAGTGRNYISSILESEVSQVSPDVYEGSELYTFGSV